ncbi:MAG TPA: hypothetical protein VF933_38960 [Streptosporangiaceae bacterium]
MILAATRRKPQERHALAFLVGVRKSGDKMKVGEGHKKGGVAITI